MLDSNSGVYTGEYPFNNARPTVHSIGSNVTCSTDTLNASPLKGSGSGPTGPCTLTGTLTIETGLGAA